MCEPNLRYLSLAHTYTTGMVLATGVSQPGNGLPDMARLAVACIAWGRLFRLVWCWRGLRFVYTFSFPAWGYGHS